MFNLEEFKNTLKFLPGEIEKTIETGKILPEPLEKFGEAYVKFATPKANENLDWKHDYGQMVKKTGVDIFAWAGGMEIIPDKVAKELSRVIATESKRLTTSLSKKITTLSSDDIASIGNNFSKWALRNTSQKIQIPNPTVYKLINVLKEAKPVRKAQETLYSVEKGKRMAKALAVGAKETGEAGFQAELGQLKGELPKVSFESIRGALEQVDIDNLFNMVKDSSTLDDWDKIAARKGLGKLFGEFGGGVPTRGELDLLNKVFPKELTEELLSKRPFSEKLSEGITQVLNIPRSIMTSFDLSAPGRQGWFLAPSNLKKWFGAFDDMFKSFGSEKAFKELQEEIASRPTYGLMKESKLPLTEMGTALSTREEVFMANWAEKIPIIGKVVRASGRAYTGFLNKFRADIFDDMVSKAIATGRNPNTDIDLAKQIADFIGSGTGRGFLGKFEGAAVMLNTTLFSPRWIASRIHFLDPRTYINSDPFIRKETLKSVLAFTSMIMTTLGISKLAGAKVESNSNNADWGKIKIGNTRIDMMAGFQQYFRAASQLWSGKYVSSTTGKEITLGEGYKPLTRYDILLKQVEAKEAPIFSFITDWLKQQDYEGKPFNITNEVAQRFIPIAIGDLIDLVKEDPKLFPIGALGIFGIGVQTYGSTKKNTSEFKLKF
jgi:hypothetical protein